MTEFVEWLNAELNRRGWSQNQLARRSGISGAAVSLVVSEKQRPTYDFCAAIARPLETRPEDVMRIAGLLPRLPDLDGRGIRELAEILADLSPEQRADVLQYARWRREQKSRVVVSLGEADWRVVLSPAPPLPGKRRPRSRLDIVWQGVELDSLVV